MRDLLALVLIVSIPTLGAAQAIPPGAAAPVSAVKGEAFATTPASPTTMPGIVSAPRLLPSLVEGDPPQTPDGARQHAPRLTTLSVPWIDLSLDRLSDQTLPPRPRVDRADGSLPARASPHLA